jgi:hypothetical protein
MSLSPVVLQFERLSLVDYERCSIGSPQDAGHLQEKGETRKAKSDLCGI